MTLGWPALYALFVWWFSTAAIILLDNLPRRTYRWSLLGGTALFAWSLYGLHASAHDTTVAGAYTAFTYAIVAWGWQEMTFFMGALTGPRRTGSPEGASEWQRFGHGVMACLWHELAIIATAAAIVALCWGAPNHVGLWTFMLLWGMRQSAKLNFFLGVLNLGEQFIPPHLGYMRSFIKRRAMNLLMPFSIMAGTAITTLLVLAALEPGIDPARTAGLSFLIAMMALAVLEHWFLVLPVPFERLWSWVLRWRRPGVAAHTCTLMAPRFGQQWRHARMQAGIRGSEP